MIRIERPPNFEQILAVFPHAGDNGVLFAYGEDIYNPSAVRIPEWLYKHELRHCARQFLNGPVYWWDQYLCNPEFRYQEELLAHVDEYIAQLAGLRDRNARAKLSMRTAARLVAPLYNYQPPRSLLQAQRDLEALV